MVIKRPELLDEFTRRCLQSLAPLSQQAPDTPARKREVKPRPLLRYKPSSRRQSTAALSARAAHALIRRAFCESLNVNGRHLAALFQEGSELFPIVVCVREWRRVRVLLTHGTPSNPLHA
jgi:hypothetical protein